MIVDSELIQTIANKLFVNGKKDGILFDENKTHGFVGSKKGEYITVEVVEYDSGIRTKFTFINGQTVTMNELEPLNNVSMAR